MLSFLTLVAIYLRLASAHGAGNVTSTDGFAPGFVNEPDGRGTMNIIYSSALTMFLSAFTSLHLNIPAQDEKKPSMMLRWMIWGGVAFLLPELMVFIACAQWLEMRERCTYLNSAKSYFSNRLAAHHPLESEARKPFSHLYAWYDLMGGFCVDIKVPVATFDLATKGHQGVWIKHTSEIVTWRRTLTHKAIFELILTGHFLPASDQSINDKSKSDYIAKGFTLLQVLWFVCQVTQRKIADLPISLLEFHTLVNIGCGFLISAFWLSKPRNIEVATTVEVYTIDRLLSGMLSDVSYQQPAQLCVEPLSSTIFSCTSADIYTDFTRLTCYRFVIYIEGKDFRGIHIHAFPEDQRRQADMEADRKACLKLVEILSNALSDTRYKVRMGPSCQYPYYPPGSEVIEIPDDVFIRPEEGQEARRIVYDAQQPRVYAMAPLDEKHLDDGQNTFESLLERFESSWDKIWYGTVACAFSAYGALQLIPNETNFNFPSEAERMLWRVSCYVMICCVGFFFLVCACWWIEVGLTRQQTLSWEKGHWRRGKLILIGRNITGFLQLWILCAYPAMFYVARWYLMVEAFIALRRERAEIFQTPEWNWLDYIPHF